MARLVRAARLAELRMRLAAALDALVSHAAVGLVLVAAALTAVKIAPRFSGRMAWDVIAGAALSVLAGVAYAASRKLPR